MWWLSFRDGSAAVIEATSLLHARMLAAVHKISFVSQFVNGYQLRPELASLIPRDCIGRLLLPCDEARQLSARLESERIMSVGTTIAPLAPVALPGSGFFARIQHVARLRPWRFAAAALNRPRVALIRALAVTITFWPHGHEPHTSRR